MAFALINTRLFTGQQTLFEHALIIEQGRINAICPLTTLTADLPKIDLAGATLCAGFIDLQLNGCGGVQFSDTLANLSIDTLQTMQRCNEKYGCTSFLPTLITSSDQLIKTAVKVLHQWHDLHDYPVLGLHLEGPWINPEKKGTHDATLIRQPDAALVHFLCDNAKVISKLTLAPEQVEATVIKQLTEAGIVVSAGHSAASYQQANRGFASGITCATHLYNAMPMVTGREPGLVGAVLDHPHVWCGIIADGYHVHYANIAQAKRLKGQKLILVTDATAPAGTDLTEFHFAGKTIYCRQGRCVDENGVLSGSALTMIDAVANCVHQMNIPLEEALRMASLYPAQALGIADQFGQIRAGYPANLTAFDQDFNVTHTWVNGQIRYQR